MGDTLKAYVTMPVVFEIDIPKDAKDMTDADWREMDKRMDEQVKECAAARPAGHVFWWRYFESEDDALEAVE